MSKRKKFRIFAYTDGSCRNSPDIGGLGFVATNWDKTEILKEYSKFLDLTTNNQAELLAIIYAVEWFLRTFDKTKYLVIVTDSRYCSSGYNELLDGWVKDGFKTNKSNTNHKLNLNLWERLYNLIGEDRYRINIQWERGHSGDYYNDKAHELSYNVWQKCLNIFKIK